MAVTMHSHDLLHKLVIDHFSPAGRPGAPGVAAAARYTERLAQMIHQSCLMLVGELKHRLFGREKMATALVSMSHSLVSISGSRRRQRIYSSSVAMPPWPLMASMHLTSLAGLRVLFEAQVVLDLARALLCDLPAANCFQFDFMTIGFALKCHGSSVTSVHDSVIFGCPLFRGRLTARCGCGTR